MPNSTIKPSKCKQCGSPYHSAMWHKPRKALRVYKALPKPTKRIKQRGKRTLEYNQWRDEVAKPYLDVTYGHVCATSGCVITEALHVDHIQNRGSHPELKMSLDNVQYLCFDHHSAKTDRIKA